MGEALEGLDSLNRVAAQDRQLVAAARAARAKLDALTRPLAAREAEARRADEAAAATAVSLAAVRTERKLASAPPRRAGRRSRAPAPATEPARPTFAGRKLTVTATGYALSGKTATGVSVAWGIVAVDPGVIALGTRMSIPGYGEGVAADTGSAIRGARIDLWFPTLAEARAWGSRTITITLL
jgi:3D (Asp-Asp-Asp) domain-containing protein